MIGTRGVAAGVRLRRCTGTSRTSHRIAEALQMIAAGVLALCMRVNRVGRADDMMQSSSAPTAIGALAQPQPVSANPIYREVILLLLAGAGHTIHAAYALSAAIARHGITKRS